MDFLSTFLAGFGLGLSLIVAIGAQNAFVLRQGIRVEHVVVIVLVCALSDAILIMFGIAGLGVVLDRAPDAITVVRWAGAAFLMGYGLLAARRAMSTQRLTVDRGNGPTSRAQAVATVMALTWLNPHVYLDTVLLVGSVANAHAGAGRWVFGSGAVLASVTWFSTLGFGARLLRGVFDRPLAWRCLDATIAAVMITLGILLVS